MLRGVEIECVNQALGTDITYIPMQHGFMYLSAVIDWYCRYILSWELSNSLESLFCIAALELALEQGSPEIFNTDQGSQFTSEAFNRTNICPYVWKPEKAKPRTRWITVPEAAKLLHASRRNDRASNHLPVFILIALFTGARSEAIFRLKWSKVDLERGYIDFSNPGDSKTKQAAIVPISNKLLGHLKRHRKYGTDAGYVIHINQDRIKSVKRSFQTACNRAGIGNVTPHVLRHTAISWRMHRRVPTYEIAKLVGHSSPQMIEQVYGHLSPEHLMDAKER